MLMQHIGDVPDTHIIKKIVTETEYTTTEDLHADHDYTFWVVARNDIGPSPPTDKMTVIAAKLPDMPKNFMEKS